MAESVLLGLQGTTTIECAYVESDVVPGVDFFAHKVRCMSRLWLAQPCMMQACMHMCITFAPIPYCMHLPSLAGSCVVMRRVRALQQLKLGKNGIEEYMPLGELSAYEQKALDEAVTILQVDVVIGAILPFLSHYPGDRSVSNMHTTSPCSHFNCAGQHQEGQGVRRTELGGTEIHRAHAV
jgi:hypothetical protein